MRTRKSAVLLLAVLILRLPLPAQSQGSVIREIYLIKSRPDPSSRPQTQIRIGLETAQSVFFKLIREGNTVQGGLFPPGFNSITLPVSPLLEESGEHIYFMELKTDTDLFRHEIVLDVRLMLEETEEEATERQVRTSEAIVSLFIDNELIASRKKILEQKLPWPEKTPPLPPNFDPFDPDPMDNPMANSVSIFQAAGLAYQIIKDLVKKKAERERVPPVEKAQQISLDFRKEGPQGKTVRGIATIRLSLRAPQPEAIFPCFSSY